MAVQTQHLPVSARAGRSTDSPISWLMRKTIEDPEILSLAAGFVDTETLPADLLKGAADRVFANEASGKAALQYGSAIGLKRLREALAARLERQGMASPDPDRIAISNGAQQSLQIITDVMVDAGDVVLVEDPTYFVYVDVLRSSGAKVLGVTTDEQGMVPEALERRLEELHAEGLRDRLRLLYVMSYFQNPGGGNMSDERRRRILEIFRGELERGPQFLLLEDACYRDLCIEGKDEDFIHTLDGDESPIALLGTFSKAFSPGMRLGWTYMTSELMTHFLRQKGNHDFGSSNLTQNLMAELMVSGDYDIAAQRFRDRYHLKRDTLEAALREHWPADTWILHPKGGMYVWCRLPGVNTDPGSEFFEAVLEEKVLYVPGYYCYGPNTQEERPTDAMRLCYGVVGLEDMKEAVRRMGRVIKKFKN